MSSVTSRVKAVKQPRGGYLKPSSFNITQFDDSFTLNQTENINPGIVGTAVDYLTRYHAMGEAKKAFSISLLGATLVGELDKAMALLNKVESTDNTEAVTAACRLTGYDVCLRVGKEYFKPVDAITPDKDTITNINAMVNRSVTFLANRWLIIASDFTFIGGYTDIIDSGDGDYLADNTLYDLKVSKNKPNSQQTLQILVYYLMGKHSIDDRFDSITRIGLYNPRLNVEYSLDVKDIDKSVLDEVSRDVIGYSV